VSGLAAYGWLLDTNVVSELCKGPRTDPGVTPWAAAAPPALCFLSRMTVADLCFGIARVTEIPEFRAELEAWLENGVRVWFGIRILDVSEDVLTVWRRRACDGQKADYTYPASDGIIAATALVHGLGVVTRNTADFERAGMPILTRGKPPKPAGPHRCGDASPG
jgi:predicted nucleic acid-binding protein